MVFIFGTPKKTQQGIADIYDAKGELLGRKSIYSYQKDKLIIDWLRAYYDKINKPIGFQILIGTDIQHNNGVYITNWVRPNDIKKHMFTPITYRNLIPICIYNSIRNCVDNSWINNKDL